VLMIVPRMQFYAIEISRYDVQHTPFYPGPTVAVIVSTYEKEFALIPE
jgi:hypothetical protein